MVSTTVSLVTLTARHVLVEVNALNVPQPSRFTIQHTALAHVMLVTTIRMVFAPKILQTAQSLLTGQVFALGAKIRLLTLPVKTSATAPSISFTIQLLKSALIVHQTVTTAHPLKTVRCASLHTSTKKECALAIQRRLIMEVLVAS